MQDGKEISPYQADWSRVTLRQKPGEFNALGTLKIMFPNKHSVYLHDTQHRERFNEPRRDFSSGCVRVQNPEDVSAWILQKSRAEIDDIISTKKQTKVDLTTKMPVHILYNTTLLDNGSIVYLDDVYGRDKALLGLL